MSFLRANCPSCAAPIEFKSGASIVLICPFCRSAVARTDRALEDLGKVAEVAESQSPLRVGLRGVFRDNRFELTGRAQLRHEMGGFWDEWYATFSNGWVGWLAEAQGRFYLTFHQPLPEGTRLPPFDYLQVGQPLQEVPANTPYVVAEKGTATAVAADGEIPYQLVPNERSNYADLAGVDGGFATIDYGMNPPTVFAGQEVKLADLGFAGLKPAEREARAVAASRMNCPNCGGPLELRAPDIAERVTCPNCDSLLDVNQGNLKWLHALNKIQQDPFVLQLGQKGVFAQTGDAELEIIGAVVRSVTIEGISYFWHEYLMYNPQVGYRWLVHSDNHWNFVESVNVADVMAVGNTATYDGKTYKIFQDAPARVEYVKGEFYWRVEQGETVRAVDYIAPPLMLSLEISQGEMNWSKGTYLTNAEIEKIFSVTDLPKPWSIAPNQPFTGGFYIKAGFLMIGVLLIFGFLMSIGGGSSKTVLTQQLTLDASATDTAAQTVFSQPFDLQGNKNIQISATAPVSNSWANLDVDLINEQNQEVESVNIPIEYYNGVEDGESWSEGGQSNDVMLSSLPAGKYTLRLEGTKQASATQLPVNLKVEQNVSRGINFCCALILLVILPFLGLFRKWMFESRRWKDSMFGGSSSSSSDSDSDSDSGSYDD